MRQAAGTDSPRQESQGVAIATASGCPPKSRDRISPAKTDRPKPAGMDRVKVIPRAEAAVFFSSGIPASPFCRAADKAGVADNATEVVREGKILNMGTARVE
jgi:hypothetical protein